MSMLPQVSRLYLHNPYSVSTTQCAQCISHIMSTSLRLQPGTILTERVHQVLDTYASPNLILATSTSDISKDEPCLTPNNYSLACQIHGCIHKDRSKAPNRSTNI